ncbi:MAG: hypothetical protein NDJ90_15535 [Oligoflexia bacterium]|nr:hypothetical protein [Oligoflexia bacterium]
MKAFFPVSLILLVGLTLATGACAAAKKSPAPIDDALWVIRSDGELSCGMKKGQPLEAAAAELERAGVKVLESRKSNDGMMRIQMCGAATGSLNAFRIARKELEAAKALGFGEAPKDFQGSKP